MSLWSELERSIPYAGVPAKPHPAQKDMAALGNEVAGDDGVFHGDVGWVESVVGVQAEGLP
jgi:hypothetical protein